MIKLPDMTHMDEDEMLVVFNTFLSAENIHNILVKEQEEEYRLNKIYIRLLIKVYANNLRLTKEDSKNFTKYTIIKLESIIDYGLRGHKISRGFKNFFTFKSIKQRIYFMKQNPQIIYNGIQKYRRNVKDIKRLPVTDW